MADPPSGERATDRLIYLVNRVARALNRAADDVAADAGVTLPELLVLLVLGEGEPVSNAQLARRTFVTSQAAHQVTTELATRGLLARSPKAGNRRVLDNELTAEGRRVLELCRVGLSALDSRVLDGMPAGEAAQLAPALLAAAETLRGGWFGDEGAEAESTARRAARPRRSRA